MTTLKKLLLIWAGILVLILVAAQFIVTDSKRVRVLYVEGHPRYDFRFVKVLLERESERSVGGKGIEVRVILLNASKGWEGTDRSALGIDAFPTREELFAYDVVVTNGGFNQVTISPAPPREFYRQSYP